MIKKFNSDRPPVSLVVPTWPENPKETQALFSQRRPLRNLRALVDAELLTTDASGEHLDKPSMLLSLLGSDTVEWYRYTNGLPPAGVEPASIKSHYPVYAGWAVAFPLVETGRKHWPVTYSINPTQSWTSSDVHSPVAQFAKADEALAVYMELDVEQLAKMRELDLIALHVASEAVQADVFITERPYLYSDSRFVSQPGVTVCTLEEAIPLIAFYLRAQGEYALPTSSPVWKFRFGRGLYYWVGARELLPEAWRWFNACFQHSSASGDEKLLLLGGSLLSRVTKALQQRDDVHIALNLPPDNDTIDEALSSLDNTLVSLMGAVDAAARVAHYVLSLTSRERDAGWQSPGWLKDIAGYAPSLAAVVTSGTSGEYVLTILRLLRNSVHGVALQGVTLLTERREEVLVGLPSDDETKILAAMDAMGGRQSWGFRLLGAGRSHVEPAILVDRLFEEVVRLLNALMKETPVESLAHVTITADHTQPPVDEPVFQERNRLAIRWQLGF